MATIAAPSVLTTLPQIRAIAAYEAAFNARRRALTSEVQLTTFVVRANFAARLRSLVTGVLISAGIVAAPVVVRPWVPQQPRDGRGRFLSLSWRLCSEAFLPSDHAFFRSPLASEVLW